jgi:Nucleoside 2-deoxyribosyltransferase
MPSCFVIQPFDRATYDKRDSDVFEPAIQEAGLEPYRVDRDPATSIPIRDIEDGIRAAEVCFAEISTDNPNVWFELGYAIALGKDVVLVCSDQRASRFPFDVQHRAIITYRTESSSDYSELKDAITKRIRALRAKEKSIDALDQMAVLTPTEGFSDHQIVALLSVAVGADVPGGSVSAFWVKRECERAGYTEIAVTLALRSLIRGKYIEMSFDTDERGEQFPTYNATERGLDWLEANQSRLMLRRNVQQKTGEADVTF